MLDLNGVHCKLGRFLSADTGLHSESLDITTPKALPRITISSTRLTGGEATQDSGGRCARDGYDAAYDSPITLTLVSAARASALNR